MIKSNRNRPPLAPAGKRDERKKLIPRGAAANQHRRVRADATGLPRLGWRYAARSKNFPEQGAVMPNDFTHLRLTHAQARELHTVLNAEAVASWDAPMRKAQAEARAAAGKPGASASGWDAAMLKAGAVAAPTPRK